MRMVAPCSTHQSTKCKCLIPVPNSPWDPRQPFSSCDCGCRDCWLPQTQSPGPWEPSTYPCMNQGADRGWSLTFWMKMDGPIYKSEPEGVRLVAHGSHGPGLPCSPHPGHLRSGAPLLSNQWSSGCPPHGHGHPGSQGAVRGLMSRYDRPLHFLHVH